MIFRLQAEAEKSGYVSHTPFHLDETGDRSESEKLRRSGQIPVSRTPIITPSVIRVPPKANSVAIEQGSK
ncbi:hypothetical protein SLA2020_347640 [Shorea laevis]